MGKSMTTKPSTPVPIQIPTTGKDTTQAEAHAMKSKVDTNVGRQPKSFETYTSLIGLNGTCPGFYRTLFC
jgi:hypothetical protein